MGRDSAVRHAESRETMRGVFKQHRHADRLMMKVCQRAPDTDGSKIGEGEAGGGGGHTRAVTDSLRSQRQASARRGTALLSEPSPQPHLLLRPRGSKSLRPEAKKKTEALMLLILLWPRKSFKNNKMRDNALVLNIKTASLHFTNTDSHCTAVHF